MKHKPSELQKTQRARAYFKFVLTGLSKPIKKEFLTKEEQKSWNKILDLRKDLLEIHDENSKEMGLKIPEHRCFACNKPAEREMEDGWLCDLHYKMYLETKL